ncbi:MAG TPA: NUDIX hydrolase [Burkholderiaceae bacterium]|nr:NUDIX hydrolase [Burkholderiaceae bacterium]
MLERFVRGEQVFKGVLLDVRRDIVAMPDGSPATREYVVHPGAVVIVPLLDDGRLVLERQYRYPVGRAMLEFPAGKLEHGEPPLPCALRELVEETGYRARQWAVAGALHNAIGYSTEVIHLLFAQGLTAGERALDHGELIDLVLLTEGELDGACARGEVTDAKTLIALLWLQKWRSGAWPLQWFTPP